MDGESWDEARLIPTSGIDGAPEQERRAAAALLAVAGTAEEFACALTGPLGAPAGTVEAFAPVSFAAAGREIATAGLLRVSRGRRIWTALLEVRTGSGTLDAARLQTLLDVVRHESFDVLLTISNEIPAVAGRHPVVLGAPPPEGVLHHRTWSQVLSEAVVARELRADDDPGRAWVLRELIRYLEHPRSGALEFTGMGGVWTAVLDAAGDGSLQPDDRGVDEVTSRFDGLLRYAGLRLGRRLGAHVVPGLSRRELAEPAERGRALRESLTGSGVLQGSIRIPDAVGALVVTADLRGRTLSCHVDVDAPRDGRPATRVRWVVRQLHAAPGDARIETFVSRSGGPHSAESLSAVRDSPLILVAEPGRDLRGFRVSVDRPLGVAPGRGPGSFADGVLAAVEEFHRDVLAGLTAWTAAPSRARAGSPLPTPSSLDPDVWIDIRREHPDHPDSDATVSDGSVPVVPGVEMPGVEVAADEVPRAEASESDLRAIDRHAVDLREVDRHAVDLREVDLREVDPRALELRALELRALELRALELRGVEGTDAGGPRGSSSRPLPDSRTQERVRVLAPTPVKVKVAAKRVSGQLPSRRALRAAREAAALLEPRLPEGTASGWRPDPLDSGVERWWDGEVWSERTRPFTHDGAR